MNAWLQGNIYLYFYIRMCVCVLAARDLSSGDTTQQEFILQSNNPSISAQKRHGGAASAADPDVTGRV